jgi:CheY-like chemotaxis protein
MKKPHLNKLTIATCGITNRYAAGNTSQSSSFMKPDTNHDTTRGLRICIVDDRPEIRDLIKLVLLGNNRSFSEASSAAEARESIDAFKPHLMLLDILLPNGESGFELCSNIKHQSDTPPLIVMMSAQNTGEVEKHARAAGADGFVAKPISPSTLREIAELAEKHLISGSDFPGYW